MQVSFHFHSQRCSEILVSPSICTKIWTWTFHRTKEVSNNFSVSWQIAHISISRWPSRPIWDEIPNIILQSWFAPIPSRPLRFGWRSSLRRTQGTSICWGGDGSGQRENKICIGLFISSFRKDIWSHGHIYFESNQCHMLYESKLDASAISNDWYIILDY